MAVVVGAGSGIGRSSAHSLARVGAHVVAADVNLEGAQETAASFDGGVIVPVALDLTDPDSIEKARDEIRERLGVPRIVVNVAGWDRIEPFLQNSREQWEKVLDINLLGPITMIRAFLDGMIEAGEGGRIVTVASDAGRVGSTGETVYAGAKGGIIAFTKSLAREMARYQITVNCVSPGPTDTPLFAVQPEKMKTALERAIPFRRLGQPEEVASAITFFASDEASFITGQVLSVSGGLTMHG
ncbi:MAG: SDR family oxidoreductase [Nocardioides sp.]|uniref:SDR family NAD(P)-dependent oxidoreductase n=1 Tax=Nocardioides sp. TaxID=35761 RepID=UPI0039E6CAB1